ncbi:hypothetical protein LCGC14_1786370 [marine sediment metagenome]|uniref:Uncharacterized protein n=1 Tax=marine sediment metagenome TaxID=412755 RepID=A0A0F9GU30_9ZZZZ
MKKDFKKDFNECPVCKSKDRFFEQLGKELRDRKIARPEWTFCYEAKNGVVSDPTKVASLLVGSKLPAFVIKTDVCMECGTMYAIHLSRGEATVGVTQAQQMPNRADRRRMEKGGFGGLPFGQG